MRKMAAKDPSDLRWYLHSANRKWGYLFVQVLLTAVLGVVLNARVVSAARCERSSVPLLPFNHDFDARDGLIGKVGRAALS